MLLTLAAAHAMTAIVRRISIPGRWLGMANDSLRPGRPSGPCCSRSWPLSPTSATSDRLIQARTLVYHNTGEWIARNVPGDERVLDMTDWSLYFSGRTGYAFADLYTATSDPQTRWIVVRDGQIDGPSPYCQVLRDLIGDRQPVAQLPAAAASNQMNIEIYDRQFPDAETADAAIAGDSETWRR